MSRFDEAFVMPLAICILKRVVALREKHFGSGQDIFSAKNQETGAVNHLYKHKSVQSCLISPEAAIKLETRLCSDGKKFVLPRWRFFGSQT